ncbi:prephenate dehydratase [Cladochytrium replicatum]|nr:prephenate dehydratase [Cladochytrium replicatum]
MVVVAFEGIVGAHSEEAARHGFNTQMALKGKDFTTKPVPSFQAVFRAVQNGECGYGLVPIENSSTGTFHFNLDQLHQFSLHVVGEICHHDNHTLLALPGVKLEDVKEVISHPYALDQCRKYLSSLDSSKVSIQQAGDTAGSAALISSKKLQHSAAIASESCAKLYGLDILAREIEDDKQVITRYVLVSREPVTPQRYLDPKTSIMVLMKNQIGAFYKALSVFALREINVVKIESRPSTRSINLQRPWEYVLYIDIDGSTSDFPVANAIKNLEEFALTVKVLGCYPRYKPVPQQLLGAIGIGM